MLRSAFLAVACLLAVSAHAETVKFGATLNSDTEVPAKAAPAAAGTATLDTDTRKLDYDVSWNGLTGPATMAHFHGPAASGKNAGVQVRIGDANPTSPTTGSATLTEEQVTQLTAGQWYANVHTAANPGGEIRGQLTRQ
jgi:hypothetical protein